MLEKANASPYLQTLSSEEREHYEYLKKWQDSQIEVSPNSPKNKALRWVGGRTSLNRITTQENSRLGSLRRDPDHQAPVSEIRL